MLYILFTTLIGSGVAFRPQSVGVKGQLLCGDQPLVGATVRLDRIDRIAYGNICPTKKRGSEKLFFTSSMSFVYI